MFWASGRLDVGLFVGFLLVFPRKKKRLVFTSVIFSLDVLPCTKENCS